MGELAAYWAGHVWGSLQDYLVYSGVAFVLFYVLLKGIFRHRKIQGKFPRMRDYRRDFLYSMITISIFAVISLLVFDIFYKYTRLYDHISDRSIAWYAFSFVLMFFIHDTYFYWIHRLMHRPKLYRYFHQVHHRSTNPSPWTAYAFHPLEAVLEVGILPVLAFTLPIHREALGWFFLFQFIYNVYGHLGYELYPKNFHRTRIGRYVNTSVAHNLHHKRFTGNYGLYTLIWDRLMGTLRPDYDHEYETVTTRKRSETQLQSA